MTSHAVEGLPRADLIKTGLGGSREMIDLDSGFPGDRFPVLVGSGSLRRIPH
jgi:hypothetical protein